MSRVNLENAELLAPKFRGGYKNAITTLPDAPSTLDMDMGPVVYIKPTAARTLTLPAVDVSMTGMTLFIINGAAFAVTVNNASAAAVAVIPATVGATGMIVCLGDSTLGVGGWAGGM